MLHTTTLLILLAAAATADVTVQYGGHTFKAFTTLKSYGAARQSCADNGMTLASLCSDAEREGLASALIGAGFRVGTSGTTELWLGSRTSSNHHSLITNLKETSGARCRILSNYDNKPWLVYSKNCDGNRFFVCESGEKTDGCPVTANGNTYYPFTESKKPYAGAKADCESRGMHLATLCSEDEREALSSALIKAGYIVGVPGTTESWLGGSTSVNHHGIITSEKLEEASGSRCRILSNHANDPWKVYSKNCDNAPRYYVCELGESSSECPALVRVGDTKFTAYTDGKKSHDDAKSFCEAKNQKLALLCTDEEVASLKNAFLAVGFTGIGSGTTELWIGGLTSVGHHGLITDYTEANGNQCRILSNHANVPWRVFSKNCQDVPRYFICESGETRDTCPAPKVELSCQEQRAAFSSNGLDIAADQITFIDDVKCKYSSKQCNDEKCFCVKSKTGEKMYGGLVVPLGQDYDCSKKARKCLKKLFKTLLQETSASYVPDCTDKGQYKPKQCDTSGECWCVKKQGREIKKTRNANGDQVQC